MNNNAPVNRIENALKDWQLKEERFGKLFSSKALGNKPFLSEKLKYFDAVQAKFSKTASEEERLALRILRQERNQIEKTLYPNLLVRLLRHMILPLQQEQLAKQAQQRTTNNQQALKEAVVKAGFDNISSSLEQNIKQGKPGFSIQVSYYANEKEKLEFDLFFTRDNNGQYQFENYKAALHQENKSQENKEQKFVFEPGNVITATHAYNLLAGRSIQMEFICAENNRQSKWIQLDFNDKDASGNHKLKEFHSSYAYDVKEALKQLPLKELTTTEGTEKLLSALVQGQRETVTVQLDGREQKLFIEANPQFRSFNIYDENSKKANISSVIGNKTTEELDINTRNTISQNVDQGRKNRMSM